MSSLKRYRVILHNMNNDHSTLISNTNCIFLQRFKHFGNLIKLRKVSKINNIKNIRGNGIISIKTERKNFKDKGYESYYIENPIFIKELNNEII